MKKLRFWASRNEWCDIQTQLWMGKKPKRRGRWFEADNNPESVVLVELDTDMFKQLAGFTVPPGRCVEITDPRVKQIRSER